jgi:thioredoxin 1
MSEAIMTITDGDFESKVLEAGQPTLVDFWAEWCAPCKALTPVVEAVAGEYQGRLQVAKMNIDDHPQTPTQYAVRAIPTLLLFKGGKVVDQVVGLVSKSRLDEMLGRHL